MNKLRCTECGRIMPVQPGELREIRLKSGGTLASCALSLGVSVSYLSDIERGKRNPPDRVVEFYGTMLRNVAEPDDDRPDNTLADAGATL